MTYGAYLNLDQKRWRKGDYSSTNKLTGTIYSDAAKSLTFVLTDYTLTIRIYKRFSNSDLFNKTASIVSASSGTWSYAVQQNDMISPGVYLFEIELSKSGEVMSTFPETFTVEYGPTA